MELLTAGEYMLEFTALQKKAQAMVIEPPLLFTVEPVNIPGLSTVLYQHYKRTCTRVLTTAHKHMLLLRRCYCHSSLPRCFCLENQALLEWCWLKFASRDELRAVAHELADYVKNNFCCEFVEYM